MKEHFIEYIFKTIAEEECGGLCLKFVSPGKRGVPDRIVLFPGGVVAFVEFKRPGGRFSELQKQVAAEFASVDARVHAVRSLEDAAEFFSDHGFDDAAERVIRVMERERKRETV